MSSISVNTITDASGGTTTSINGYTPTASNMAGRNRIINGDMRIDQRNAGASVVVGSGAFPVDRWFSVEDTDGALTAEQVEDVPSGFVNSVKITTTTADSSLTTTQTAQFMQNIEGFNVSDLGFGSASAQTVALSFWVKSSLTGTMGGSVRNDFANRSYPFSYTISVANTWEYKTVTIDGDTSGTWLTNNGLGFRLVFSLGCGPSRLGTAGAWNANNNTGPTGEVPVIGTLNATWQITGVQLEAGSVATPFEHRQYGQELALCQRYFTRLYDPPLRGVATGGTSGGASRMGVAFPTVMRAIPTLSTSGTFSFWNGAATTTGSSVNGAYASPVGAEVDITIASVLGGAATGILAYTTNSTTKWLDASSEL